MAAPAKQRKIALNEALHFCAVPRCFNERGLDVHHINQISTDHRSENLIALCPTHHHAWCHWGSYHDRLTASDLHAFKFALDGLVPGRLRNLHEVLETLQTYYEEGNFALLEYGVYIQFKVLRRTENPHQDPSLIARLNEYLGEVAILNGASDDASRFLFRAMKLSEMQNEVDGLSHCYGLVALDRVNWNDFRGAIDYLDRSIALLQRFDGDQRVRFRRTGWLHHLHVSVQRKIGNASGAMAHVDLADENYARASSVLNDRELADGSLVRAMALAMPNDQKSLQDAHNIIVSIEKLVHANGWMPTRARVHLQKFRLLLKLQEFGSAREELLAAWRDATQANALQYIEEILHIASEQPELCTAELCDAIWRFHGICTTCSRSDLQQMARCCRKSIVVLAALGP